MATDRYAVFGFPISHSKSPRIHTLFAEQTGQQLQYGSEAVSAEQFEDAVDEFFANGGKGLNCTLPLKELAYNFVPVKSRRAELAKAVNTLVLQEDGILLGDNTDGSGLIRDLTVNHQIGIDGASVLILGAGGATRGIIAPILELAPRELVVSNRTEEKAVKLAAEFAQFGELQGCGFPALANRQFDLIINATSASLSGDLPPLPNTLLPKNACCYDLAYGNKPTAFVEWGHNHAAKKSVDGLGMLVEQAAEAFYIWRSVRPETKPVIALLNAERGLS